MMKNIILVLMVSLFLVGCYDDNEPTIDVKYLAVNQCKYTGETFEAQERKYISVGRTGSFVDETNRYYVYVCPDNKRVLSTAKLVLDNP